MSRQKINPAEIQEAVNHGVTYHMWSCKCGEVPLPDCMVMLCPKCDEYMRRGKEIERQ